MERRERMKRGSGMKDRDASLQEAETEYARQGLRRRLPILATDLLMALPFFHPCAGSGCAGKDRS